MTSPSLSLPILRRLLLATLAFLFVLLGGPERALSLALPGVDVAEAGVAQAQDDAAARRARRRRARRRRARREREREAASAEESSDTEEASGEGDGGDSEAGSLAAAQENNLEFEGSAIQGETAGRGAVVLYNRTGRAFEPLARMQRRFLRTSVLSLFGRTEIAPEEERRE